MNRSNSRGKAKDSARPTNEISSSHVSSSSSATSVSPSKNVIKLPNPNKISHAQGLIAPLKPHHVPTNFTIPKHGRGKDKEVLERILKRTISISSEESSDSDSAEENGVVCIKKFLEKNLKPFKVEAPYYMLVNLGKEELIKQKAVVRKNLNIIREIGKITENYEFALLRTIKTIDKLQDNLNSVGPTLETCSGSGPALPDLNVGLSAGSFEINKRQIATLENEPFVLSSTTTLGESMQSENAHADDILDSLVKEFFPELSNTLEPVAAPLNPNVLKFFVEGTV